MQVTRIVEPEIKAHPVTLTNAVDIMDLIARAQMSPKWSAQPEPIMLDDGSIGWRVHFTRKDLAGPQNPLVAQPFSAILEEDDLVLSVLDPVTAANTYHADTELVWQATTVPPAISAKADGTGTVVVRQPSSLNGPWGYTVALTDHTSGDTTDLEPQASASVVRSPGPNVGGLVLGADITLPLAGLIAGHEYSATVTVTCIDYGHSATSPASAAVTVPEPEPEPGDDPA